MQAQTTGRNRDSHLSRIILGIVAGLGLTVAAIVGIQAWSDGQTAAEPEALRPVSVPAVAGLDTTTLILDRDGADVESALAARPAGSVDTTTLYLDRDGADISEGDWWGRGDYAGSAQENAPGSERGPDITTLNLDRDGADIVED